MLACSRSVKLENCVVSDNVHIRDRAALKDCELGRDVIVDFDGRLAVVRDGNRVNLMRTSTHSPDEERATCSRHRIDNPAANVDTAENFDDEQMHIYRDEQNKIASMNMK